MGGSKMRAGHRRSRRGSRGFAVLGVQQAAGRRARSTEEQGLGACRGRPVAAGTLHAAQAGCSGRALTPPRPAWPPTAPPASRRKCPDELCFPATAAGPRWSRLRGWWKQVGLGVVWAGGAAGSACKRRVRRQLACRSTQEASASASRARVPALHFAGQAGPHRPALAAPQLEAAAAGDAGQAGRAAAAPDRHSMVVSPPFWPKRISVSRRSPTMQICGAGGRRSANQAGCNGAAGGSGPAALRAAQGMAFGQVTALPCPSTSHREPACSSLVAEASLRPRRQRVPGGPPARGAG